MSISILIRPFGKIQVTKSYIGLTTRGDYLFSDHLYTGGYDYVFDCFSLQAVFFGK